MRQLSNSPRTPILAVALACALAALLPASLRPVPSGTGHPLQELERELVANLSSGRVLIAVTRDAIVLGTAEIHVEAGSRPPAVIQLGSKRLAVVLGAVEWVTPDASVPPVHLDAELSGLINSAVGTKHLGSTEQANDLELMGTAILERLRVIAGQLHRKVDFGPDEPLIEIVLADYLDNYGPEVWDIRYRVAQDSMRGDFWRTRVLRPSYNQLYPPEKGQPKTLIEVRYPEEGAGLSVIQRLRESDAKLIRIGNSDPRMTQVVRGLLNGESQKLPGADAGDFLRAALPAVADADSKLALGVLYQEKGLDWLIAPPKQKAEDKSRPAGAPSLVKKPDH